MRSLAILIALLASSIASFPTAAIAETVLITGANSGIGLEFTRQYAAKGWTIIATHRRSSAPKSLADIAADWTTQTFGKMRFDLFDTIMAVNVKGPLIVSEAFFNNVKASAQKKLVAISSSNGTLTGEATRIDEAWAPVETVIAGDWAYQRGTFTVAATPGAGGSTRNTRGNFLRIYLGSAWTIRSDAHS